MSYKLSAFTGKLYRCYHSTTSKVARDQTIEISLQIYSKINTHYTSLIEKFELQTKLENPDLKHYTLSLNSIQVNDVQISQLKFTK